MKTIDIKDPFSTPVGTIGLCNGKTANLLSLTKDDIDIEMIAHSLSLQNRYNGQTGFPISVATHSVLCLKLYQQDEGHDDPITAMAILLHDAEEAFWGDMISPIKRLILDECPRLKELIDRTSDLIFKTFGVLHHNKEMVGKYDRLALTDVEWPFFFRQHLPPTVPDYMHHFGHATLPRFGEVAFMQCFNDLADQINAINKKR